MELKLDLGTQLPNWGVKVFNYINTFIKNLDATFPNDPTAKIMKSIISDYRVMESDYISTLAIILCGILQERNYISLHDFTGISEILVKIKETK